MNSNSFFEIGRFANNLQKVMPGRISNARKVFVIRNNSCVQIFRNDEKERQRHFQKNTLWCHEIDFIIFFVLDFVSFTKNLNSASD